MMSLKLIGVASVAGAAFLAGIYVNPDQPPAPSETVISPPVERVVVPEIDQENTRLKAELEHVRAQNGALNAELADVRRRLTVALQPPAPGASLPLPQQQRQILNNLRQIAAARDQYLLEHGRPASSIAELVGLESKKYIRFINSINGEDYSGLAMGADQPLTVMTKDGMPVTYDPAGNQTTTPASEPPDPAQIARQFKVDVGSFTHAWQAYLATHNNTPPKMPDALLPYFATPKEGADFAEAIEARNRATRR